MPCLVLRERRAEWAVDRLKRHTGHGLEFDVTNRRRTEELAPGHRFVALVHQHRV